jgi:phosphate transport system protein
MDKLHLDQHISRQFNKELEDIRSRVLTMGGLTEKQLDNAIQALVNRDIELSQKVIDNDDQVNLLEVSIDAECRKILARRQPTASDLRLVIAITKTTTDLERVGDEAEKIARMASGLSEVEAPKRGYDEIENMGMRVRQILYNALDAFARMDVQAALKIGFEDKKIDREYEAIIRQCITFMMEDPRSIRRVLDLIWAARALERIGDHARNIAEQVIFLVEGKDVRHTPAEDIEREVSAEK